MLKEEDVKQYWEERSAQQGAVTVGRNGLDMSVQDAEYDERKEFIFKTCPKNLITLDYGCGVGRYAPDFNDGYVGYDITENLLKIARSDYPDKNFIKLNQIGLPDDIDTDFELFFTATVLQHNPETAVYRIFDSLADVKPAGFKIFLYENDAGFEKPHVKGRSPEDYLDILENLFEVKDFKSGSHVIHQEQHSYTYVEV